MKYTVHDTENLTFPRNFVVVPRRYPRIVVQYDTDYPQGGHGSSARADTNLLWIWVKKGGNQKGLRKTSQGSFE